MSLLGEANIATRALAAHPLRSALAMLGVAVGVGSIITMVSLGQGARWSVLRQVESLGTNVVSIVPGKAERLGVGIGVDAVETLTWDDARAIEGEIPHVEAVSAEYMREATVVADAVSVRNDVSGITPAFFEMRTFRPWDGTLFGQADLRSSARVAVLGKTAVKRLFGDRHARVAGASIRINRMPFRIVGVLEEKGVIGVDWDKTIFVPLTTAQQRLFGVGHVRAIYVKVQTADEMDEAAEAVRNVLRARHRLGPGVEDDFTVRNQAEVLAVLHRITRTLAWLLGSIATISLIVGGIGIMNIMLAAVVERTREIGIRIAVGATRYDILRQFLIESIVLSVAGGIVGLVGGIIGTLVISAVTGWPTLLSAGLVVLAVSFSAAVGTFFGIYPASQAAKLDPVIALRYE